MMENMIGDIARTMQNDRRAEAARNERVFEAIAAHGPDSQGRRMRACRATIAKALIIFAARLAPPVPEEAFSTDNGDTVDHEPAALNDAQQAYSRPQRRSDDDRRHL